MNFVSNYFTGENNICTQTSRNSFLVSYTKHRPSVIVGAKPVAIKTTRTFILDEIQLAELKNILAQGGISIEN